MNDIINLTDPICSCDRFQGTFDGNGKTIELNLQYDPLASPPKRSLFRNVSGTIKNLTVTGSTVFAGITRLLTYNS